jgi:hypothetical protein
MKNFLLSIALFAFALCVPAAFAQHGGHGYGGGRSYGGGHAYGHAATGQVRASQPARGGWHATPEARGHYVNGHFDVGFRGAWFGYNHPFYIGHPYFYGGGWRFWYGGFWWGYGGWPYGWAYTDQVYVDCPDGDPGVCYLYSPLHPGVTVELNVIY